MAPPRSKLWGFHHQKSMKKSRLRSVKCVANLVNSAIMGGIRQGARSVNDLEERKEIIMEKMVEFLKGYSVLAAMAFLISIAAFFVSVAAIIVAFIR